MSRNAPEIAWNHKKQHLSRINDRNNVSPMCFAEEQFMMIGKWIVPFKKGTGYRAVGSEIR